MTTIRIAETGPDRAAIEIDGYRWDAALTPIFTEEQKAELDWYFEEWLRFPFTDRIRARDAATSITRYGQALFEQLFADREAWAAYKALRDREGAENLRFEIIGSPAFHGHHWEALKDPKLPEPFVLIGTMLRKNTVQPPVEARPNASTTFNLLVVTARPGEGRDVGYRTITRPLIQSLRQARLKLDVDLVRPGTWQAFVAALETQEPGFYHAVHFDLHGALRHRPGLAEGGLGFDGATGIDSHEAILAFEAILGGSDPRTAAEVADLLLRHRVPLVVLNACQSGKQVGASETSLAARLMQAGVQHAIAMAWSVTVTAAERLIPVLYQRLFAGENPERAILAGRRALAAEKDCRAYMNERIDLEDWLLPVVHENRPLAFSFEAMSEDEDASWWTAQAVRSPEPPTAYGFFGRDLDVLRIEKALLTRRNILLVQGMGGSGKTTLLRHLMHWGEVTGLVERSVYFGWDTEAWTRARIMRETLRTLYPNRLDLFDRLADDEARQAMLAQQLRADRHLLVLDNLESATGERLAIQNSLTEVQRTELKNFLAALAGGRSLVLLGSRTAEAWLAPGTFADNIHRLSGLDTEAASDLADAVLDSSNARERREERAFADLLRLLDGYPLALEVVLPNLKAQSAKEVHDALQQGLASIDQPADGNVMAAKTKSLLACIEYSHGHLDPAQQTLLLCFAPFTGVIRQDMLSNYIEKLKAEPVLAVLPLDDLDAALTYHQLGRVAEEQRRFDEAAGYYWQSLDIKLKHGNQHDAASTYLHLGVVAQEQRRFDEAAAYYRRSLDILLEYGNRHGAASTYHQLGSVVQEQRRFDEAAGYYRQSLDILLEYGDHHGAAFTYGQLGNLMRHTGRYAESLDYYLNALPILAGAGDGGHLASITFSNLARLWRAWDNDIVITRTAEVTGVDPAALRAFFEQAPPTTP